MVLFYLLLVGIVIVLVGHAIWVALRALARGISDLVTPKQAPRPPEPVCPRCGTTRDPFDCERPCLLCGWSSNPSLMTRQVRPDLAINELRRQVERWTALGVFSPATHDQLDRALLAEQTRLAALAREKVTAPARSPKGADARLDALPRLDKPAPSQSPQPARAPLLVQGGVPAGPHLQENRAAGAGEAGSDLPPATPHRWFDLLAGFLEEKSIRWGELVGGLLIVGCSLALVISFWASIAERPWVKYGLLNGVTALLFGLGIHADRRWKLPTTARGLTIIATLLTPLNFLAVASLVGGVAAPSPWNRVGELIALVVLAPLILAAGWSLVAGAPGTLLVGVLVPSASMLLLTRSLRSPHDQATVLTLGAIPWIAAGTAVGGWIGRFRRHEALSEERAVELLRLVGLAVFAATIALGLVIAHAGAGPEVARWLSPLAPVVGGVVLAPGLLLWRRIETRDLVGYRIVGTALAAAGVILLSLGIVFAWPDPARILPGAALDCVLLITLAIVCRIPAALALAGGCCSLVALTGWAVASGRLAWSGNAADQTATVFLSAASGAMLVPLALGYGCLAAVGASSQRWATAQAHAVVAGLAALLSLALVTRHGFGVAGDPAGATWVYATFALAAPLFAGWWSRYPLIPDAPGAPEARTLGWLGSGLALVTLVQGLVFAGWPLGGSLPVITALLAHASGATVLGLIQVGLMRRTWNRLPDFGPDAADFAPIPPPGVQARGIVSPILDGSIGGSSIAAAVGLTLMSVVPETSSATLAGFGGWLTLIWVTLAAKRGSTSWFAAGQAALTFGVGWGGMALLEREPWFARSLHPWLDPRTLQVEGIAFGGLCLVTTGIRVIVRRWPTKALAELDRLLNPTWPAWDRLVRGAVVLMLVVLAGAAVLPGAAHELALRTGSAASLVNNFTRPPLAAAVGSGSWMLWGLTLLVLLAGQWERVRRVDLLAALGVGMLAAPLAAGQFAAQGAAASAWWWFSVGSVLVASVPIWARESLGGWGRRVGWKIDAHPTLHPQLAAPGLVLTLGLLPGVGVACYLIWIAGSSGPLSGEVVLAWGLASLLLLSLGSAGMTIPARGGRIAAWARPFLFVVGLFPIWTITVVVVVTSLAGRPVLGLPADSWFGRVGAFGVVVPPLVVLVAVLVGYALRDRSARFAFAAGILANLTASTALILLQDPVQLRLDAALLVGWGQITAIVAAATTLVWMGCLWFGSRFDQPGTLRTQLGLLETFVPLAVLLNTLILSGGTLALWVNPQPTALHQQMTGFWGWLALSSAVGLGLARLRWVGKVIAPNWVGFGWIVVADFLALGLSYRDRGHWLAYHGVMIGQAMAGIALPLLAWRRAESDAESASVAVRTATSRWSLVALAIVVLFALGGYGSDPQSPWWTVGGLLIMGGLAAGLLGWTRRSGFWWLASGLGNLAATCWWCAGPGWWVVSPDLWRLADLLVVNCITLALPAPLWLAITARTRDRRTIPFHQVAAWVALSGLTLVVLVSLARNAAGSTEHSLIMLGYVGVGTTALAFACGLRDDRARAPVAGFFLLGLVAVGWAVVGSELPSHRLTSTGTMVLAAYSVATSILWNRPDGLRRLAARFQPTQPSGADPLRQLAWLVPANLTLAAAVLILALMTITTDSRFALRTAAAYAALAECLAIGLLAQGNRRTQLQVLTLAVGIVGAIGWGWAWIEPGSPTGLRDRAAVVLALTLGGAAVFGLARNQLHRRVDEWIHAARSIVPTLIGIGGCVLGVILIGAVDDQVHRVPVAMAAPAVGLVAITLVGAIAAALIAAVVPGRDPFGGTQRGRTAYVYGAEILLAALGAHVRLHLPWLFSGRFVHYWPLMLMALAFGGVALSEIFRRQQRPVLAEPLERTAVLLPILPLLVAFWNVPRPGEDVVYLALVGVLYAVLATLRSSLGFGVVAVVAGNAAGWAWLRQQDQLSLLVHPQVWVIPPALCVLIGGYLNRDRLTRAQLTGVQYGALLAIYLASTGDIILSGVAQAPWLPVVLAALAVGGIFAGIMFRVRGFLFLGTGFLSLALFSIIWYAAVDLHQTWLWAASGILAGIFILAVFALFEKKRLDVLRVVSQIREWSP